MDHAAHLLLAANELYIRDDNGTSTNPSTATRPAIYKPVGISLAIASGCFIGVSFVLKKVGLLKANEKYQETPGEGYGYLKNTFWWTGMTLMIVGEICNFVAYAFVDAILVTPLGALSVVITTILSAIFLKERLSMVGKVGCFLCIIGSVVIVLNAPQESAIANIQQMQSAVIAPGFLSYAGVVILGCAFIAFWAGPRYGKKSMLVYLSICSLIGGLSVVATQGLGAAIITQIGGTPQFNQWFLYVLFVFVVTTLVTEIIYLNKALNLFNAALVTPTYYVFFTSSTIVTSAILTKGFKGTAIEIITVVMGFLTICAGVVLLQLSKSAKDVPDAAVFSGDLDQVRTIAEQEQPETEPKADAIRGAAAIVRRFSVTRQKMEMEEARRLHAEKQADLEPIGEDEHIEWDGLRRRRTTLGTQSSRGRSTSRPQTAVLHPPLGMSRFPDLEEEARDEEDRPSTGGLGSSFFGSFRHRARTMTLPGQSRFGGEQSQQSPMHPVPLTEITTASYKGGDASGGFYGHQDEGTQVYGLPHELRDHKTAYEGAGGHDHVHFSEDPERSGSRGSLAPEPPPHSAKRQFSFQNVFRKSQPPPSADVSAPLKSPAPRRRLGSRASSHTVVKDGATEEERLGLVKGDTSVGKFPNYDPEDDELDSDDWEPEVRKSPNPLPPIPEPERAEVGSPPRRSAKDDEVDEAAHEQQRHRWSQSRSPPPPFEEGKKRGPGNAGAFL